MGRLAKFGHQFRIDCVPLTARRVTFFLVSGDTKPESDLDFRASLLVRTAIIATGRIEPSVSHLVTAKVATMQPV